MFSLDKTEELVKVRLISSIWNNQFDSPEKIENLFTLSPPDIIVLDENEQIALLVDIKAEKTIENQISNLSEVSKLYLKNADDKPRFVILANLAEIKIFKSINDLLNPEIISLKAEEILKHYDAKFNGKTIFKFYLKTLIESWLRDLAYHWKPEIPPGSKELENIGLLAKIKHGETYSQNDE
jgi:hypothetical protein